MLLQDSTFKGNDKCNTIVLKESLQLTNSILANINIAKYLNVILSSNTPSALICSLPCNFGVTNLAQHFKLAMIGV